MNTDDHLKLQTRWRNRVIEARALYNAMSRRALEAQEAFQDVAHTDGHQALRQTLRDETAARREYRRVLRLYIDLVLNHKTPAEEA